MATTLMSEADHARVATAVRAAETKTDGEIYCVIARASDSWFAHAGFAVSLAAMAAGLVVAFAISLRWGGANVAAFAFAQASACAAIIALLWRFPAMRIAFVPKRTRYRRAHQNALRQFLARNVHRTAARTGVLIFISVAERYAEIIADAGINAKVPQHAWNAIVARLLVAAGEKRYADGFVEAVQSSGALLSAHFPKGASDINELDDHVVEL
ncbi:MAG: TPM domain-containing protein [Phyllobacteriaceae bacterium]|nr:TPM domain-containing protein [Phyllobacteriaceae bacterium]